MRILVTGATGYVGSRVVPRLLAEGHEVVAATRGSDVSAYPWANEVEIAQFDVESEEKIRAAVAGVDAVIYLVHSMDSGEDFVRKDRAAAVRVAHASKEAGVQRIVYLSGLIPHEELSDHLRSRLEVEQVFLASGVPTTSLRAAMVLGGGSASFETLRRVSSRLPITPVPSWMNSQVQPIAVADVLELMVGALQGEARNRAYDAGGPEVVTYPELLRLFEHAAGLRRLHVPVPLVPVDLAGAIVSWISWMPRQEIVALTESLAHDMVAHEDDILTDLLPHGYRLMGLREALRRSLRRDDDATTHGDVEAMAATDE